MDKQLFAYIDKQIPQFNERICSGYAVGELVHAEEYIDRIWRCAAESFPTGFQYLGYERCTPQEEYNVITAKRHNRQSFEVSPSNVYMVKYLFRFQGEDLKPRYIYLPYVRDCGIVRILGSDFQISPVLADKAFSVGVDNLFIQVNRDKLTFKRLVHSFYADATRVNSYVVWSPIYHASKRSARPGMSNKKLVDAEAATIHYLFCKYGVTQTFAQFADADVVVGFDDINETTFKPDEWVICRSSYTGGMKPRGVRSKFYTPTLIRLAIRRSQYNRTTESMIAGFFYIADHFTDRVRPESIDDRLVWMILLGYTYIADRESEGKLANSIEAHIESLDDYVDFMAKEALRNEGIPVNDIYELFYYVIEHFSEMIATGSTVIASMYDKRLKVLHYVLFDIISAIFNTTFALKKFSKKNLSRKEVLDTLNKELKTELVFSINQGHQEASSISSPGDNMIFKITSSLVLQTSSMGNNKSKKSMAIDASKFLHASIAEVGSYTNLPKSDPTGRNRINPCVRVAPDGSIERNPDVTELLDTVQRNIQR